MAREKRSARLLIYATITLLAMWNTIRHMFEGVRPFDWLMLVVELAVLLLILYEVIVGILRHREAEKRRKQLANVSRILSGFMIEGQNIRGKTPDPHPSASGSGDAVTIWINLVTAWHTKVAQYLSSVSGRAESAFSLIASVEQTGAWLLHQSTPGTGFYVTGHAGTYYRNLLAYLQNLQGIIEKLDVYF